SIVAMLSLYERRRVEQRRRPPSRLLKNAFGVFQLCLLSEEKIAGFAEKLRSAQFFSALLLVHVDAEVGAPPGLEGAPAGVAPDEAGHPVDQPYGPVLPGQALVDVALVGHPVEHRDPPGEPLAADGEHHVRPRDDVSGPLAIAVERAQVDDAAVDG